MPLVETILFDLIISAIVIDDILTLTQHRRLEACFVKMVYYFCNDWLSISTMISTNESSDGTSHGKQSILLEFYDNINCSIYIFATIFEMYLRNIW